MGCLRIVISDPSLSKYGIDKGYPLIFYLVTSVKSLWGTICRVSLTAKCDVDDDDKEILEEAPPEDCGHRFRTPTDYYQADFSNIMYKYPDEAEVINMCYHGARYGADSGVE